MYPEVVIHDLNAFWPVRPGSDNMLHNALYGPLSVGRLTGYLSWEIAVTCSTPGLGPEWWGMIMAWGPRPHVLKLIPQIIAAHTHTQDLIRDEAYANSLSITREDGLDWLRTMLARKPRYRGPVPIWTKRALREEREERGFKTRELAAWLGIPTRAGRVGSWLNGVV